MRKDSGAWFTATGRDHSDLSPSYRICSGVRCTVQLRVPDTGAGTVLVVLSWCTYQVGWGMWNIGTRKSYWGAKLNGEC
jgi:hypothetical protein